MIERRHFHIVAVLVLGALSSSCARSHNPDTSSGTTWLVVPCQDDRSCDTVHGAVACGAEGYCVDDAGEPVVVALVADLDAGPPEPTDAGALDRCNMECRAEGADSDGQPIEYLFRTRVQPDGSQWVWCGLDRGYGVGGRWHDDCQAAFDEGCQTGSLGKPDAGTFMSRYLEFKVGEDGVLVNVSMHLWEDTTDPTEAMLIDSWTAALPYSSCVPVTGDSFIVTSE